MKPNYFKLRILQLFSASLTKSDDKFNKLGFCLIVHINYYVYKLTSWNDLLLNYVDQAIIYGFFL